MSRVSTWEWRLKICYIVCSNKYLKDKWELGTSLSESRRELQSRRAHNMKNPVAVELELEVSVNQGAPYRQRRD